jgi:hypothetical protein
MQAGNEQSFASHAIAALHDLQARSADLDTRLRRSPGTRREPVPSILPRAVPPGQGQEPTL